MSEAFGTIKKTNSVALLLIVLLVFLSSKFLYSGLPLDHKAKLFFLSFALVLLAVGYEVHRLSREEELEKEALRRKLFGG